MNGPAPSTSFPSHEDNLQKLVCKNNGVLLETDLIQIGVKAEFRKNLGRLGVFYGNKGLAPFQVCKTSFGQLFKRVFYVVANVLPCPFVVNGIRKEAQNRYSHKTDCLET